MGQKPLEPWQVRRINQLKHDALLSQSLIAKRLNISRTAVRRHLLPREQWEAIKKRLV